MRTVVLRVWLPDRPGALGQVASRIGALRGDVIGIEILERGGGQVVDELLVDVPTDVDVDLLAREVCQVDGVAVEEVRSGPPGRPALEVAAELVEAPTPDAVDEALVAYAGRDLRATWAAVVGTTFRTVLASTGPVPPAPWILAFVEGSRHAQRSQGPDPESLDTVCVPFAYTPRSLVVARAGGRVLTRERHELSLLVGIADRCHTRLRMHESLLAHPSINAGGR